MPMVATVPLISLTDAQTYFNERLNTGPWDDASSADQMKALQMATGSINRLRFRGVRTDPSQANSFPRDGDTVVPDPIQRACAELALQLLNDVDPNMEIENIPMTSESYASVRSNFTRDFALPHIMAGITSPEAWQLLLPYLADPLKLKLRRK